jgi:1-acyl-sn-glycerol-3-phosphate acyltransferase
MSVLRTIWYLGLLLWTTMVWGGGCIALALVGVGYRKGGFYDRAARYWGSWLCRWTGLDVRVEGMGRFPPDRPYVFIANHFSFADIWALLMVLPDSVRFVAKKELFWVPLFGWALKAARHIPIDRENRLAAFSAYDEAGQAIRNGISAIVFAEGTRSWDGKLRPFKKGPFVLAIASQVPVIPVWVEGAYDALPKGRSWVKPGVVTLRFGAPVATQGLTYDDRDTLMERVRVEIVALAGDSAGVRVDPPGARR